MIRILVVVVLLSSLANAGTLVGKVAYTSVTTYPNGTSFGEAAQTVTFKCSGTDPVNAIQVGTGIWSTTTCGPPTQTLVVEAVGYSPRDPGITNFLTCLSESPSDNSANSTIPSNFDTSGAPARRLLGVDYLRGGSEVHPIRKASVFRKFLEYDHVDAYTQQEWLNQMAQHPRSAEPTWIPDVTPSGQAATQRRLLSLWDSISSAFSGNSPDCWGIGPASWCSSNNGVSSGDATQIAIDQATILVGQATKYFLANITAVETAQGTVNTQFQTQFKEVAKQTKINNEFQNTTRDTLNLMEQQFINGQQNTNIAISNLYANISTGLTLAAQLSDQHLAALQNVTVRNFQTFLGLINDITDAATTTDRLTNRRFMELASNLQQVLFTLYYSPAGVNRDADRMNKIQYFNAKAKFTARGRIPFIRPLEPGTDPVPLKQQKVTDLKRFIESDQINFMKLVPSGVDTIIEAHQYTLVLRNNIATLSQLIPDQITYDQLMSLAGPSGCVANATASGIDPVYNCRAWWEVSHKYCTAAPGFNWTTSIQTQGERAPYTLVPAYCAENVQPSSGIYDGTAYDSIIDLQPVLGNISCNSFTDKLIAPFQVYHTRTGITTFNATYDSTTCNFDFFTQFVADPNNIKPITLPQVIFSNYKWVYPLLRTERTASELITYGILPGGMTSQFIPFVTASDTGRTVQCYRSAIDTITTDTNVIYRVTPQPMVASITTTTYNGQPDCTSIPGVCQCIGCDVVSTVTTASAISIDTTGSGPAFSASDILVGELIPASQGGMSFVVDAPEKSKCTSPDLTTCIGTGNLIRWDFPTGYVLANEPLNPPPGNLADVEALHPGQVFDMLATTSNGYWERPISQGKCTTIAGFQKNTVCNVLDNYSIHPNTNMRKGGLTLVPDTWEYTITQNIGIGELTTYRANGCPTITLNNDNILGKYITLTNPTLHQIYVVINKAVGDPSTCASIGNFGSSETGIPASLAINVAIPANCGNVTIQVQQINQVTGQLTNCGLPVRTDVPTSTQGNIFPSMLSANATTVYINNSVATATAATTLQLIQFQIQISYEQQKTFNPDITIEQVQAQFFSNTTLAAYIASLMAASQGVNVLDPSFVATFSNYSAKLDTIISQSTAQQQVIDAQNVMIAVAIDVFNRAVQSLNSSVIILDGRITVQQKLLQQQIDELNTKSSCPFFWCQVINFLTVVLYICILGVIFYVGFMVFKSCSSKSTSTGGKPKPTKTKKPNRKKDYSSV